MSHRRVKIIILLYLMIDTLLHCNIIKVINGFQNNHFLFLLSRHHHHHRHHTVIVNSISYNNKLKNTLQDQQQETTVMTMFENELNSLSSFTTSNSTREKYVLPIKTIYQNVTTTTNENNAHEVTTCPSYIPVQQRRQYKHIDITSDTAMIPKKTTAAQMTPLLQYYQNNISNSIIKSFSINEPFNPLYTNNHIQTIGGFLLRNYGIGKYISTKSSSNHWFNIPKSLQQLKQASLLVKTAFQQRQLNNNKIKEEEEEEEEGNKIKNVDATKQQQAKLIWWDHREKINTPDGDWFHADFKYSSKNNNDDDDDDDKRNRNWEDDINWNIPTVILLHGLNSHSQSSLSIDMAKAYINAGMNCICLNFRGCTDIPNDTLRFYHLGFTDDIQYFLQYINEVFRKRRSKDMIMKSPIFYLSGFSLGANVVLKCLGELGENALIQYNVYGSSVLCAPLDSVRNSIVLSQPGINQQIYTKNLLNGLKQRAAIALERFCNNNINTVLFDYERVLQSKTICEFDDAFTSQIYNYNDCWDYYKQTSSIYYLDTIAVPTMILNSKDDPFFDSSIWPIEKSCLNNDDGTKPLYFIQTDHGGHLGYSFHQISENDERNTMSSLNDNNNNNNNKYTSIPCWASIQAANFIQHIQQHDNIKEIQQQKDYDLNYDNTEISRLSNFRNIKEEK